MGGIKQFTIGTSNKKKSRKASKPRVRNQDRWFLKSLEDVLGYSRPWKAVQKFYPSMLGNPCDKYLYYAYHGGLANQEVNPKLQRIFDTGSSLEQRMEKYLRKAGLFLAAEQTLRIDTPPISGRYDFLINYKDNDRAIVELKSINDKGFQGLIDSPKPEHTIQLQIYLNIIQLKNGVVVYENKNDQELKAFKVQQSADVWNSILERCLRIQAMSPLDVPTMCTGAFYCACREVKQ